MTLFEDAMTDLLRRVYARSCPTDREGGRIWEDIGRLFTRAEVRDRETAAKLYFKVQEERKLQGTP